MEIEVKYNIGDKLVADKIWEEQLLQSYEEAESREKLFMKSAYFDTEDMVLYNNSMAFRVRLEGNRVVATLKWQGNIDGALHQVQEINVPVDDEACFLVPSPELFKESEIGQELIALLENKHLICIVEVHYIRRRFRIDKSNTIMEISIDEGEIVTDKGKQPISEVEIELFSGEQEELVSLGQKIAEKYDLTPGVKSKYLRGLELLGIVKE